MLCNRQGPALSLERGRHPFFRSYGTNLPNSLALVLLPRLGFLCQGHLSLELFGEAFWTGLQSQKSSCTGSWYGLAGSFPPLFSGARGFGPTLSGYSPLGRMLLVTRLLRPGRVNHPLEWWAFASTPSMRPTPATALLSPSLFDIAQFVSASVKWRTCVAARTR